MIFFRPTLASTLKLGGMGIAAAAMCLQPYRPMIVVGRSMEPTYHDKSLQWTEPVSADQLKKGLVVEINMPTGPIVKRIAFLGGDKIRQIRVGDHWMDMLYVHLLPHSKRSQTNYRNFVVPEGTVYVLGDNQVVSYDSRNFGCVPIERIKRVLLDQEPPAIGNRDRDSRLWD